jgi:allantoinase
MLDNSCENNYYDNQDPVLMPLSWPGGKPVVVAIVVSVEYYDLYAPPGAFIPANVPGGFGRGPYPDIRAFSVRDYGSRVGFFRICDALSKYGIKATLAVDAHTVINRPVIVETALSKGWDVMGHGLSGTHVVSSLMTESEERVYIAESLAPLTRLCGKAIEGWHGPEYGQSANSPRLLAESGIRYLLDWPNDDRPVPMRVPSGSMLAIPMSADLDDVYAHWNRKVSMAQWVLSVKDALQQLSRDGHENGTLLVLNIHPWLMGQPYRTSYFTELLEMILKRDDVLLATPGEIARWSGH